MTEPGGSQSTAPATEPSALPPAASDSGATSTETAESAPPPISKGRSPLLAALLSFVWPGLGQMYARRHIEAAVFAVPVVVLAVWFVLQLTDGLAVFAAGFFDDTYALTFLVLVAVFGIWRGAAMFRAYAVAGIPRRPRTRAIHVGVLGLLLVSIIAMHGLAFSNVLSVYNFDHAIADNSGDNPPTDHPVQPTDDPGSQPAGTPSPSLRSWEPGTTYAPPNPTEEVTPPPPSDRITILLTGVDWQIGRGHSLNDSLLVVSLDTRTHKVAILSVPRDTSGFELYWGGMAGPNTKLNSFYTLVASNKIHAPDPPLTALTREIGWLVGVNIDYYAVIDLHGFSQMVQLIGGVCVINPRAINDPSTGTFVPAGYQCLDGPTTLKYVRSREGAGDSDYSRSSRQQDVLIALEQKLATPAGLAHLSGLLALAGTSIQTNFPLKTVKSYVSIARNLGPNDISKCVLGPPYNYHPPTSTTKGTWTSRLKMYEVAGLSVHLFGTDSRFYGMAGITPRPCGG